MNFPNLNQSSLKSTDCKLIMYKFASTFHQDTSADSRDIAYQKSYAKKNEKSH